MIWWFDDDLMMTWWWLDDVWVTLIIDYHWFSHAIAEHRSQRVTSAQVRAVKSSAFRAKLLGDTCWIEASKPQQLQQLQQLQLCKRITSGLLETTLDHFGPLWTTFLSHLHVYYCLFTWDNVSFRTAVQALRSHHLWNDALTLGKSWQASKLFQPVSAVSAVLVQCCQWVKTRPRHFRWHRTTKESDGSLGTETSFAGKSLSMSWDYESSNIFQLFPLRFYSLYIALNIASHQSV